MTGLEIDWETADRITLASLKDQYKYLVKEVNDHEVNGSYMHPDDYYHSRDHLIPALEILIKHYGGEYLP